MRSRPELEAIVPTRSGDPVQPRKLIRDRAREAIAEAILDGTFQPGEVLDDAELQKWLQISRTPIRQALYALSIEGLIDMAPQSHTRVVEPKREYAISYLQTTGVLVSGVTELVAHAVAPPQREEIVRLVEGLVETARARDHSGFVKAMAGYFSELNALNPNPILAQLSRQAMVALGYYVSVAIPPSDVPWDLVAAQQELLLSAWRVGDPESILRATHRTFGLGGVRWADEWPAGGDGDQGRTQLLV